jgi:peptidoglycan/xylan/chitin deacetylase (PgdA/CDA1 family)
MMKTCVKTILRRTLAGMRWGILNESKRYSVRVLMYHRVEPKPANSYAVSEADFEEQMKYLRDMYRIVSMDDVLCYLNGEKSLKETVVAVTIDDGEACLYKHAFPVLQKFGIPACIFQTTKELAEDVVSSGFYLSEKEIKVMHSAGIAFGAHTRSHCCLSAVEKERGVVEISGSKVDLERVLGEEVQFFAYPYGLKRHFNKTAVQIVQESGYKCAFTAINGVNYPGDNLYLLKRTKIERGDSFSNFKKIVNGALDIWGMVDSI